uniref:Cytochrome P450 n=1 Tax=Kalanchoe fedtschenkoi TaxID=63787 RepID=A0A7N0UZA3_KALFE
MFGVTTELLTTLFAITLTFFIISRFVFGPFRGGKKLPPSPRQWPLLGNLPEYLKAKSKGRWLCDVLEGFDKGIACVRIGSAHLILVSCPKIVLQIVKEQDAIFASRPKNMSSALFSRNYLTAVFPPHGDQWKKMRKILTSEYISPARLRWFHDKRNSEADNLVKWIYNLHDRPVNLRTVSRHYGANVTRKMVFGRRYLGEARADGGPGTLEEEQVMAIFQSLDYSFSFAISDFFPILTGLDLDGQEKQAKEAFAMFNRLHDPIIEERIRKWRNGDVEKVDDFLDIMITLKDSYGKPLLSTEEIKAQVIEIFMASTDNVANSVEWVLAELLSQPELMRKAVKEVDEVVGKERLVQESDIPNLHFLNACARESFRLHPTAYFIPPHVAMADTTVAGYFIPKGSQVNLSRFGVGRNPKVWDDPLVFKPERHMKEASTMPVLTDLNARFISFGLGRRGCVAGNLGSLMTMMLLALLVQGFDWEGEGSLDLMQTGDHTCLALAKPLEAKANPRLPPHLYGTT